jgi:hypothetical protein
VPLVVRGDNALHLIDLVTAFFDFGQQLPVTRLLPQTAFEVFELKLPRHHRRPVEIVNDLDVQPLIHSRGDSDSPLYCQTVVKIGCTGAALGTARFSENSSGNLCDKIQALALQSCGAASTIIFTKRLLASPTARDVFSEKSAVNEWASFSTRDFPENRQARDGDRVRIVMLDVPDRRPVEDVVCTDAPYRRLFESAGLGVLDVQSPLATGKEATRWVSETSTPPWTIYVLSRLPGDEANGP